MERNWTKILTSKDNYQINVLISVLKKANINAIAINKTDSTYLFGYIELFVHEKDISNSKKIIRLYNDRNS